jgi:dTDP-4-dehydrorhamnose 3,5-epimerase
MNILPTSISGLMVVETIPIADTRGGFARLFCDQALNVLIGTRKIVQINHSRTVNVGAVRGMHFQYPPHAEMKLVRCLKGRVWDLAIDLRHGSPTFLHWHAEELTPNNGRMMVIPEGFAHGFQVLEPDSELLYLHTAPYTPSTEGGVLHNDPKLGIQWPLKVTDLSERDAAHPLINEQFQGVSV